ncbi:hypothetical protein TNCV_2704541 [Trichonephila clavipes]|nr:hypothetical protein TNCV_2704541 [Trichonephila clavipes]
MVPNSKRKRNVLSIETRLEILNRLAKRESGAYPAQIYNVEKSTIFDMKKAENPFSILLQNLTQKMARRKGKPRGKQTMLFLIVHSTCRIKIRPCRR